MKKRERKAGLDRMRAYIAVLQPLLRLQHWNIAVVDERPADNALADNCTFMRQYKAQVRFSDRHLTQSPEEQRNTAVHELLHIVVEGWYRSNLAALDALGATAQEWARERHEHETEMCIDTLAHIIAPHMPLPPIATSGDDDVLAVAVVRFGEE